MRSALATVVVLAVASLGAIAPAGATSTAGPTLEGIAHVDADRAQFVYTLDLSTAAQVVTFATDQDTHLPIDDAGAASVVVDRGSPRRATRTVKDLSLSLGRLGVGRHTVQFTVPVPTGSALLTTSSATSVVDGTSTSSPPVTLTVNSPDLDLSYDDPDYQEALSDAGFGVNTGEIYRVANIGSAATSAELVLHLPAGIELGQRGVHFADADNEGFPYFDTGTRAECRTSGADQICRLGVIRPNHPVAVQVNFVVTAAGPIGTSAPYSATLAAVPGEPADADTANNTLGYDVHFTGVAALTMTARTSAAKVPIGQRVTVTLTMHNAGPQDAVHAFGFIEVFNDEDSRRQPPFVVVDNADPASAAQRARAHRTAIGRYAAPPGCGPDDPCEVDYGWDPETIAMGDTATTTFVLEARYSGRVKFLLIGFSGAGDPGCPIGFFLAPRPCQGAQILLSATERSVPTSPRPTTSGPSHPTGTTAAGGIPTGTGTGSGLANTGPPTRPLSLTALALLLAGAALTRAGRRRVRA